MEEKTPLYIGYPTLGGWLATTTADKPVLAMPLCEPGTEHGGLRTDTLMVLCQQIDAWGHVHYCRLRAASLTRCFGEPFDADWQEREAAWHSLWAIVTEILQERGLSFQRATVAMPTQLRLLEARDKDIVFDPQRRRFVRRAE